MNKKYIVIALSVLSSVLVSSCSPSGNGGSARPGGGFTYNGEIYTIQLNGETYDQACAKIKDDNGNPMLGNDPWSVSYTPSKALANVVEPNATYFTSLAENGNRIIMGCDANSTNTGNLCQEAGRLYKGSATTSTCTQCGPATENPLHSADNQIIKCIPGLKPSSSSSNSTSTTTPVSTKKTPGQVCDNGGQCASGNCNRDDQGTYRCSCTAIGLDYSHCKPDGSGI